MGKENEEFYKERFAFDSADVETSSCTEIDTDTSSSVDAEADEKVVNLCDVLKEFMQQHPDAYPEDAEDSDAEVLDVEELRLSVRMTLEQASRNGTLSAFVSEAKPSKTEDATIYPLTEIVGKRAEVESDKAGKEPRDELLSKARTALLTAAFDGRLAAAVEETMRERPEPSLDELRLMLQRSLSTAACDGRLTVAIEETKQETAQPVLLDMRLQIRETLLPAADDGRLNAALAEAVPQQQETLEDIRLLTQRTLTQACQDGGLEQALQRVHAENAKEASLDAIKFKVKNVFSDAATDGRLELAFESVQRHKQDDVLRKVTQAFADAVTNGCLNEAFSHALGQHASGDLPFGAPSPQMKVTNLKQEANIVDLENVRSDVRMTLAEALQSGNLQNAMEEIKQTRDPSSSKELRVPAHSAFITAADTTPLDVITDSTSCENQEDVGHILSIDEIRASVRQVLTNAQANGALSKALAHVNVGVNQPLLPVKPSVAQPLDYELHQKLRSTFLRAASSGRLATVLAEVKEPEKGTLEELRQQVKLLLGTAEHDGRLANVLSQIQQSNRMRQTPCNAANDLNVTSKVTLGLSPISSSKRNRRIVGGISREPAVDQPSPPSSVSPKPGRHSMVSAFRMDIYGGSATANPSVPRGYDDVDDGLEDSLGSALSQWSIPAPHGVSHLRVQPGSKLPSYSHGSRTPKSSSSRPAIALDLDKEERVAPSARRQFEFSTPPSQPLGSVRLIKAGPKLPSIFAKGVVSYPICDMGLSAHQWDVPRHLL